MRHRLRSSAIVVLLSACSANAPPPAADSTPAASPAARAPTPATSVQPPSAQPSLTPSAPATAASASTDTTPAFIDTVWRAGANTGVEAGSTYTFRRDGTLLMTAPHGTPSTGQWRYESGTLTMVEEGVAYPTDIVSQDATHLVLRSHNPGGSVEIALVADAAGP